MLGAMSVRKVFLLIIFASLIAMPIKGFSERESEKPLNVSGRWELGVKVYLRDVGDSPFNQTNILSIRTNEEYLLNSFELKMNLYNFFYGYVRTEGIYGLEKNRLVNSSSSNNFFSSINVLLPYDDNFIYWTFTEWRGEFNIYGLFLGLGRTLFSPSPAKVFKIVNFQNEVFGDNKLQVWLNWDMGDYFVKLSYAPRDKDIPKFFEYSTNSLEGEDMVYFELGGMISTFEVGLNGFWDTNFGVGLWGETSLGERATLYSQFSAMDKTWILKPDLENKSFNLSKPKGFDITYKFSLGGSYHLPELFGTLYLEWVYNFGGLNGEDWDDYKKLSDELRALTGYGIYHAVSQYINFLFNFRVMEYSLMYSVLHWQVDNSLLEGFDGGVSFVWSYPSDFLTHVEVKYDSSWGFFVKGEGVVLLPNGGEFSLLPSRYFGNVYLGWAYNF